MKCSQQNLKLHGTSRASLLGFHYKFESQTELVKKFLKVREPFSQALAQSQTEPRLIYSFVWK